MNLFYQIYDEVIREKSYAKEVGMTLGPDRVLTGDHILEIDGRIDEHSLAYATMGEDHGRGV